jgi:hypothetical protein
MRTTGSSAVNVVYCKVNILGICAWQFFGYIPKNWPIFPQTSGHPVCNLESLQKAGIMFLRHPVVCIVQCSAVKVVYIDYIMRTTGCSAVNVAYISKSSILVSVERQ